MSPTTLFFALSGGILPSLLWLWFWLQEDRLHPEPRGMIIRTFIAGIIAVPLVLPLEKWVQSGFSCVFSCPEELGYYIDPTMVIFLWAVIEEFFKWFAAYFAAIETKEYDEPIDAVVYMLTAALGFAAMENALFLISSISNTNVAQSIVTGNLRFIGATLLHVLSSGVIGLFLGLSFCKGRLAKKFYLLSGLASAIALHTVFNIFIMRYAVGAQTVIIFGHAWSVSNLFIIFSFVWVAILLLIAGFQKVKRIKVLR